ncbi:MAG: ABC transporter ATP-binding protein [Nitrospira sp.]
MNTHMLEVDDVTIEAGRDGFALQGVSLSVAAGEVVGIVGDSGAGKSLLVSSITGTLRSSARITNGQIRFNGKSVLDLPESELRQLRGRRIAYIGPNPHSLLHPTIPVGKQVRRFLRAHEQVSRADADQRVAAMFAAVGIPDPLRRMAAYPHELSGGMAQRVVIAIGLICRPDVIVADEPTAGLDVTIQAQVLQLIKQLVTSADQRTSLLIASRDLGIIAKICDRAAILGSGRVAELRDTRAFFDNPATEAGKDLLLAARGVSR